ncbi:MAG: PH domain-containing protein [Arcanobacterium sp.]|nr:PH domain-containing protein [Arcanobacterium sp.]
MAISHKLLGDGEYVLQHMHEHIKKILLNIMATVLIVVAVAVGLVFMPDSVLPWGQWVLGILGIVLVIIVFLIPWIKWITTTFTITNRRIITRTGVLNKRGHDIPLSRISNVAYDRSLLDRIFGCGTLVLETSADSPLSLHDIPHVEQVHVELTNMLFAADREAALDNAASSE